MQVIGGSKGTGLSEKHQRAGPSPAHSSCLASAVNQPCHSTAHTAEGASWGQSHIHKKHTYNPHPLHAACLLFPRMYSHSRSVISCVVLQNFLVRKSRTSHRNVLCVRLVDESVPSFVQQFGIREEHSSKSEF